MLSALHLDVLQNLILSSALPDGLLRALAPKIAGLLAPYAGLQAVMQSSNFGIDAVRAKVEAISGIAPPPGMPLRTRIRTGDLSLT